MTPACSRCLGVGQYGAFDGLTSRWERCPRCAGSGIEPRPDPLPSDRSAFVGLAVWGAILLFGVVSVSCPAQPRGEDGTPRPAAVAR